MSHHADYPLDPRLDITDVYCFTGTLGTVIHPSTVFVMNVAPLQSRGWNPDGYYKFRVEVPGASHVVMLATGSCISTGGGRHRRDSAHWRRVKSPNSDQSEFHLRTSNRRPT